MSVPDTLSVELVHFLTVSGIVFGIGIAVALSKRNAIAVLMGVELMLNGVNLALIAFSRFGDEFARTGTDPLAGHAFVVFVLTVAAAEAAVALALAVLVYRRRDTIDLDRITLMRW
jgi:NADH:ubiquinone oxidoreductase subunit K